MSEVSKEGMSEALDRIFSIAESVLNHKGTPPKVEKALDAIISISRCKFDTVGDQISTEVEE